VSEPLLHVGGHAAAVACRHDGCAVRFFQKTWLPLVFGLCWSLVGLSLLLLLIFVSSIAWLCCCC
jgi:hypothetical protein